MKYVLVLLLMITPHIAWSSQASDNDPESTICDFLSYVSALEQKPSAARWKMRVSIMRVGRMKADEMRAVGVPDERIQELLVRLRGLLD